MPKLSRFEEDAPAVSDLSNFVFQNIIGCLAGLVWCYIVVVQFDPKLECPADGCWRVVGALAVWTLVGVAAMPWLSVLTIRSYRNVPHESLLGRALTRAHPYSSVGGYDDIDGDGSSRPARQPFDFETPTLTTRLRRGCADCAVCVFGFALRWELESATLTKCRLLLCHSSGTAWSVGLFTTISSCVNQLEYQTVSTRYGDRNGNSYCGDSVGCALKGVLILVSSAGLIAVVVTSFAILAMGLASRFLARGNLSPVFVEMMLMLRSNLYYSVAYTWAKTLGLLWFAPYELAPVAENALTDSKSWSNDVRALFAAARALTLIGLFTRIGLYSLGKPPKEDDVESTASAPWLTCAKLLCFKACAVTVAIAGNDAAQGIIEAAHAKSYGLEKLPSMKKFSLPLTLAGLTYAGFLLVFGGIVYAVILRREAISRRASATNQQFARYEAAGDRDSSAADAGPRFFRLVYNWLVIFATWAPWKRLIIALYTTLGRRVGPVILFPFQIGVALSLTFALALASAILDKCLHALWAVTASKYDPGDSDDADDESRQTAANPFLDAAPRPPHAKKPYQAQHDEF